MHNIIKLSLHIHDNPVGVMTNNPPFDFHLTNLNQYLSLTSGYPGNRMSGALMLKPFGVGLGAFGLPGDFSSQSRFVKAAFVKCNSPVSGNAEHNLVQFFRMLDSVAMPLGSVALENGTLDKTIYTCCFDAEKGVYYYKTYENSMIYAVDMHLENLDSDRLIAYPMENRLHIVMQNKHPKA